MGDQRSPGKVWWQIAFIIIYSQSLTGQNPQANDELRQALRLADLYNWADAAPAFAKAEQLFKEAGDRRNELYSRLGRIRSNIDRDQQALPVVSAELAEALEDNPLLQGDKELRMFCLIVKGDIDTETNTGAMRKDWEQVETLSQELGNRKWQYRALAQLGIAAFYNADLETARKDVGTALEAATNAGDTAAQVRFLTILSNGLLQSKAYDQALAYLDNATKLASRIPDGGYQFTVEEFRIEALIGLKQLESAQRADDELLLRARETQRGSHEVIALGLAAEIAATRGDRQGALRLLEQAIRRGQGAGLTRLLAEMYGRTAEIDRRAGDLDSAERFAGQAAAATQSSGSIWAVPRRLMTLAEIQEARGRYTDADRVYDRAEAFIDSLIGNVSTALEKTAVITASSQLFSQHFALLAERLNNPTKGYAVIEQVRGRVAADLLASGSVTPPEEERAKRKLSQLRLKLMEARSTETVRALRDQIFLAEQTRWITPGVNILKANSRETIGVEQFRRTLPASAVLLEYVLADPTSYCLTISRAGIGIVRLDSKAHIETLIGAYLKAVKSKLPAAAEAHQLYEALLRPVHETARNNVYIVVRDGQLHLLPFDALREPSGRYVAETRTVMYSPSATSFYRLSEHRPRPRTSRQALLAIGGIPYSRSAINRAGLTRGYSRSGFADLPSSEDEVRVAQAVFPKDKSRRLLGTAATESAFKRVPLQNFRVIHLAVHGFADSTFPDRASLVLLSDRSAGEDGFLQASEVAQLHLDADLVVLSACDTAVGALEGQEGIANLSRAFLLAGARTVVSTLWEIDDSSSLYLMRRFYAHLAMHDNPAVALTAAKRDMLRAFGHKTLPFEWAAFTVEGQLDAPIISNAHGKGN
ncbi:MAG: CHAT domain-containing protein [Bryobacteraceae bacterium]